MSAARREKTRPLRAQHYFRRQDHLSKVTVLSPNQPHNGTSAQASAGFGGVNLIKVELLPAQQGAQPVIHRDLRSSPALGILSVGGALLLAYLGVELAAHLVDACNLGGGQPDSGGVHILINQWNLDFGSHRFVWHGRKSGNRGGRRGSPAALGGGNRHACLVDGCGAKPAGRGRRQRRCCLVAAGIRRERGGRGRRDGGRSRLRII